MRVGHAVAAIAALALLLVMALDWYGSAAADEARRLESITENADGAEAGEVDRRINEDARILAESEEKNAWQVDALIDRVILVLMLGAIALALLTAIARASGGRPATGPASLGSFLAASAAVLVAYRIVQEPGFDESTTIELGAPLAVLALAGIALGLSSAMRADEDDAALAANAAAAIGTEPE
jgi:hypothetical protein